MGDIRYANEDEFWEVLEPLENISRLLRRYNTVNKDLKSAIAKHGDLTFTNEQQILVDYVCEKIKKQLEKMDA